MTYYEEAGYLQLLKDVMTKGVDVPNERTGVDCRKLFNVQIEFNLNGGDTFPIPTVRPTPNKMAFYEGWFILNGHTDTKLLEDKGVMYWKGNTTREFLDKRGLHHLPEGNMGAAYGHQLRNFGGSHLESILPKRGADQLAMVCESLTQDKYGRRHLVSYFNPNQNHLKALVECFYQHQFYVHPDGSGDVLNMALFSRSCDAPFGLTPNVVWYSYYLLAMANLLNMKAGKLTVNITDCHIYHNQIEYVEEILTRPINPPPSVKLKKELTSLEDLLSIGFEDFEVEGLTVNNTLMKTPRPEMVV